MNEELIQRNLIKNPARIGQLKFYNIGSTTVKALKDAGIIRSVDYGYVERKKVDAIIMQGKNAIAIIEYKTPQEFNTPNKRRKAIMQEVDVAYALGCKLIIATDGTESVWINALTGNYIVDENEHPITRNFNADDQDLQTFIGSIIASVNNHNDKIRPSKFVNPTDLAKQIWQDIWSVSGASPENCLYTFVELFIFKYLSDLGVLKGSYSFDFLMACYKNDTHDEVLQLYASHIRPQIKELFKENIEDGTTIINGSVFVNKHREPITGYSSVFHKILRKFEAYGKLENIDYDFKSQLFESFLRESISKKNWGQYFTPLKVVKAMVKMANGDIREGISICDPACGVGKFLLESVFQDLPRLYPIEKNGEMKPKITLHGFDKGFDGEEQKTIILAKANMLIYFSDLIRRHPDKTNQFAALFNHTFSLKYKSILGTLAYPVNDEYDLILTNPPYVTSGSSNLKDEIQRDAKLSSYYTVNGLGIEGLFMEWIVKALKPGGKAYVVVPDGMLNRYNDRNLRRFILSECTLDGVISLPVKTFFTTDKKTCIIALTKKTDRSKPQTTPVFAYIVSEIGESRDAYRFDIDDNDLQEAVMLYSVFKHNPNDFHKFNRDPRCKTVPVSYFVDAVEKSWLIDGLWDSAEQKALGISVDRETVSVSDFSSGLNQLNDYISDLYADFQSLIDENKELTKGLRFTEVAVTDDNVFEMIRGKRITKKIIDAHKGKVPVYSSSKLEHSSLGYIDRSYLVDNNLVLTDRPAILFNLDGSVGHCFIRRDKEYSFIDVVASLRPLSEDIYLEYLLYELRKEIAKTGAKYTTKLYFNKIKSYGIKIKIPVDEFGRFDMEAQKAIAKQYERIDKIKETLRSHVETLIRRNITV